MNISQKVSVVNKKIQKKLSPWFNPQWLTRFKRKLEPETAIY